MAPTKSLLTPASDNGVALVDHLTLRYPRPYRAVGDRIEAVAPAGAGLDLTGFVQSDVQALNVTDPNRRWR